jgi:hypothetical protein
LTPVLVKSNIFALNDSFALSKVLPVARAVIDTAFAVGLACALTIILFV